LSSLWLCFVTMYLVNCMFPGGSSADHGQSARDGGQLTLQPDSAAADVADTGGPGAPPAGESDRPYSVQTRRPRATLRPQDPCCHRAVAD